MPNENEHRNIQKGAWIRATIPNGVDNGGCIVWKCIEGRVVHADRRKDYTVLYLSNNQRVMSDYVTFQYNQQLLAA